jgi:tetratricopeptide (TPR) repeat protein/CHAT domain-containing protein
LVYYNKKDHDRAIADYDRAIAIDPKHALAYNNRGLVYYNKKDYERAIADYNRAIGINPQYALAYANLANVYKAQARYADAEPLFKRALAIREKELGPNHLDVGRSLNSLALLYQAQARYADAEPLYKRVLSMREKALGPDHLDLAQSLHNLAWLYQAQARYVDAESLYKRALAIYEKAHGPDHPNVTQTVNNLGVLYQAQGRHADAESLYKRSLAIREKALGPDHPDVAQSLNNLAWLYQGQAHYADAEPLYKRALSIREKALGPDHPNVASSIHSLAWLYQALGRYADAEPLYKRALSIREKALGSDHPDVSGTLNNLAILYQIQGRYGDAEPLYKRSLVMREKALGPDHHAVALSLGNLAYLDQLRGRYADAEPLYKRSLAIYEKALGPDHPEVGRTLGNLAWLYRSQARYAAAEPLYKRALAIREKALGPDHPDVANSLINLASLYQKSGKPEDAVANARRATSAILAHAAAETDATQQADKAGGLVEQRSGSFITHVATLADAARVGLAAEVELGKEGFEIAQWAVHSAAASALQLMAARTASGAGPLAALVRESQDLSVRWRDRDKRLIEALSKSDRSVTDALRKEMSEINGRLGAVTAQLARDFPDYLALSKPQPLTVEETQKLLRPGEALVFWVIGSDASYVFAVTREDFEWHSIKLGSTQLAERIAALRRGLNIDELTKAISGAADAILFDLGQAHMLYKALLGPVEALIRDKDQLFLVPTGALTGLPMHLLVTERPALAVPDRTNLSPYRDAAWLLKRHAVSVLPAVVSLKALRTVAYRDAAVNPLVGFGDPVFKRGSAPLQPASHKIASTTRAYSEYWRGSEINRENLANGLIPLPESADELKAVAASVGAGTSSLYLGENATETMVKRLPLSDYRIVYFATHALVAGAIKGLGEPALALTLPETPSALDDGLLTTSEVTELKLNADWVVLSACNTAAGDKPGAEALRCQDSAGLPLVHRFRHRHPAYDIDVRDDEIRPSSGPERGAASGNARPSERCNEPLACSSRLLGSILACGRRSRTVIRERWSLMAKRSVI